MKISISWRYGVVGLYWDRAGLAWHLYPVPFVRVTFGG